MLIEFLCNSTVDRSENIFFPVMVECRLNIFRVPCTTVVPETKIFFLWLRAKHRLNFCRAP